MLQADAMVSLLLGGLGALVGLLVVALWRGRRWPADRLWPACALAAGLGAAVALPLGQSLGLDRHASAALGLRPVWRAALERELQPVVSHPRLVQATRGMALRELQRHVATLTRSGLRRLSDEELRSWARLRLQIAESSPAVCARMWDGQPPLEGMAEALERLSPDDQRRWARIAARAAWLELEDVEPVERSPRVSLEFGLQLILDRAAAPDAELLRKRLEAGELGGTRACSAMKVVLQEVERLEPGLRESVLRALAAS